ncbi:hypothetical protein EWM64_g4047 [Hericium alpestre]|uniref:Uncharacterized protein n=1 Tax=Hericium alpestre TaxID=135208 RepID=A0A4Y9ZZQ0_9AGAM|nr:hypothetical protein EWM64_g4047 [Hericium alpestre]
MADVAPPVYTPRAPPEATPSASSGATPSAAALPATLRVGGRMVKATLVDPEDVKVHLGLLRAFWELRQTVEVRLDARFPPFARTMHPEQRWAWFVTLAVERFDRWSRVVTPRSDIRSWVANEIPPLDVCMVWHAYLLNPQRYAEDCNRILPQFAVMRPGTMLAAVKHIGDISAFVPPTSRKQSWLSDTRTQFDPFDSLQTMVSQALTCPQCNAKLDVPYITEDGKGYTQQNFSTICQACRLEITKETLAVGNFTSTLAIDHRDVMVLRRYRGAAFLPGTIRTPEVAEDGRRAERIKSLLLQTPLFALRRGVRPTPAEMGSSVQWSMDLIRKLPTVVKPRTLNRILSSYSDQRPFSVELVGAVLRQGTFVKKMQELGWTKPGYFDDQENSMAIVHAVVRYHAFLDLMSSSTTSFFVPTLDIDLVWHTHQLFAVSYQVDCKKYVGRYIDHDDKVEETHLSNAFDLTCRAWNARFNVPYMHCGCPLPGDTVGQKLPKE